MSFSERIVNAVVSLFFRVTCRVTSEGLEKLPLKGPAILISNHTSLFEGPLFYVQLRPRRTVALVKKELWSNPFTRTAMKSWGSIPVDRGGMDMKAIRGCFGVLDDGNFLCIAPEGTRSKTGCLRKAMPGTTFFASRQNVPVYPMVQWGVRSIGPNLKRFRRTDVVIRVGEPFLAGKEGGGKLGASDRQAMADEMMFRLAELLPEEFRGHYSDDSERPREFARPYSSGD